MQQALDWTGAREHPISGRTRQAKHAGATGAAAAHRHFGRKVLRYLEVLERAGATGISDFAAFAEMDAIVSGVNAINSIRNSLEGLIEHTREYDATEFGTRRGRYRLSADGLAWMRARREHL